MACDNATSIPADGCAEPGYVFLAMNKLKRLLRAVDEFQQQHAWLAFPVAVFPLLLVLFTVLDKVLKNNHELQQKVDSALKDYPIYSYVKPSIGHLNQTGILLVIGLVGTFIGAL